MPVHWYSDSIFKLAVAAVACSIIAILGTMSLSLVLDSQPVLARYGIDFVTGSIWNPVSGREVFGILPYLLGTAVTSAIALLIAIPLSLGVAIFLSEMSPGIVRTPLSFVVELLAAVPSVIYGFWGLFVLRFWLRDYVERPLSSSLGFLPIFQGTPFGLDIFTAGIILAIMVLPTISSVSRDVMRAVPNSQREAAYSLGATRWEVVRMSVLSYSRSGIVGAAILGLGRAMGETMAVTMVIGNAVGPAAIPNSLFQAGQTMASLIANEFNEADPTSLHVPALIGVGLVLLIFALAINVFSVVLVRQVLRIRGGAVE